MKELKEAIEAIERAVSNPRAGLGRDVFEFVSRITPMVNVDLLIKNKKDEILLTWRSDDFYGPGWHIPGGIVRFKETFEARISAVAKTELGAEISFAKSPKMVQEVMHPDRATRGHFVSLLFECALTVPPDRYRQHISGTPKHGEWGWHKAIPNDMIKIHRSIYHQLFNFT